MRALLSALDSAVPVEDYPDAERGACCLVYGATPAGRPMHVVCAVPADEVIVVTVYEPKPPKWITPTRRAPKS